MLPPGMGGWYHSSTVSAKTDTLFLPQSLNQGVSDREGAFDWGQVMGTLN